MENRKELNALLISILLLMAKDATAPCPTEDCVIYDISAQATCMEVDNKPPTHDCRWAAGLNINVDQGILYGKIMAYKLLWSSGWSVWFLPGINDIDIKFNPTARNCTIPYKANTMRRMWSYFYDHSHSYIICMNS